VENLVAKLQSYAAQVLCTPDEYAATLQVSLSIQIKHYHCLLENTVQIEREMAPLLSQTQGAFLTSIKGIGIVLASGVTGELGDPFVQKPINNLVSYAGIIPRVKQSGGPEGQVRTGRVSKRSNHILKNYVVQSGSRIGMYGPDDLRLDYKRRQASGQHVDFGIARRFLRTALCLMKTSQIYLPPYLRNGRANPKDFAQYYLSAWPLLRDKWKRRCSLKIVFDNNRPLGQWRQIVQELYGISLDL